MKLVLSLLLLTLGTSSALFAADFSVTKDKINAAMQADVRTVADIARDENRKPVETLEFFGLRDDMRIIELIPGGGWYSKILAPVMRDKGQYFAAIGTTRLENTLLDNPPFDKVKILAKETKLWRETGDDFYSLALDNLQIDDADMVLTFRNYHNFNEQGRKKMNEAAFSALKPGGIYAVVDHTARHMEPANSANRRRVDPVLAIHEIQQAGFEFVEYSNLHYREDDELRYEVGAKTVTGNTDRWTFKFRKPN
ncbi:MAG: putative methyltransferase [Paraglaciecola sp.]|jgi:predicted methyltransferase